MTTVLKILFTCCALITLTYGRPAKGAPFTCELCEHIHRDCKTDKTAFNMELKAYFDKCIGRFRRCHKECRIPEQTSLEMAKTFDKIAKIRQAYNNFKLRVLKIRMSSY